MVWLKPDKPSDTPASSAEMVLLAILASAAPSTSDTKTMLTPYAVFRIMNNTTPQ